MKISLYACLYMNIICWRFHIKTLFALFTDRLSDRPTEWSTDQSTDQSTNQPTHNRPTDTDRPTNWPKPTNRRPTNLLTYRLIDWLTDLLTYYRKKGKSTCCLGNHSKKVIAISFSTLIHVSCRSPGNLSTPTFGNINPTKIVENLLVA